MKALVIYDSAFGNTEKVAGAIASALGSRVAIEIHHASKVPFELLMASDLLVVGAPTQGFRPTKPVMDILKRIRPNGLRGVNVAAFDTRFKVEDLNSAPLRFMVNAGGYAAHRIAARLKKAGGDLVAPPEGFYVEDTKGPLKPGELERAMSWANSILDAHFSRIPPSPPEETPRRDA
jgi:flavodoxin